jgi:hypothetical protein
MIAKFDVHSGVAIPSRIEFINTFIQTAEDLVVPVSGFAFIPHTQRRCTFLENSYSMRSW